MLRRVLAFVLLTVVCVTCTPAFAAEARPILVLGDSLSAAYGIASDTGWVHLLQTRIDQSDSPRKIVNASISGETSAGGLARLPALIATHKPALVILELGANDALRGLPVAEPRTNLGRIITLSKEAGVPVILLGIEIPVNYGPQYRDELRKMYRGLADKFNIPLLPFLLDGVADKPDLMQPDGLHPRAAGQPRVLDNVWSVLEPVLADLPG